MTNLTRRRFLKGLGAAVSLSLAPAIPLPAPKPVKKAVSPCIGASSFDACSGVFKDTDTIATLNGLFKEVYASKLENLIPTGVKLLEKVPFDKGSSSFSDESV